jgi:predicted neuraminidase
MQMKRVYIILILCIAVLAQGLAQEGGRKLPVITSQLIFPPQSLHAHGSTLVQLPNGDMLCAWFMGSGERTADDVKILGARLLKNAKNWSAPFEMADTYNIPDCNPVLFLNKSGKLFLVWIAVGANRWESSILRVKTATDFLQPGAPAWNWQDNILLKPADNFVSEVANKLKVLPSRGIGWSAYAAPYDELIIEASKDIVKRSIGWMTRIKPLILDNGRILLPLYSDGFNFSLVAISDNDGETWHAGLPIVGRGNVQPALALRKDGHIIAYMRDNGDSPSRVQVSESSDNGETWTAAVKTDIPNTASVELLVLKDGRWVFVGNDLEDGRNWLSLFVSTDEGKTWKKKYFLEYEASGKGSFSYPSLNQSEDGLLRITYSYQVNKGGESIKYVVADPGHL